MSNNFKQGWSNRSDELGQCLRKFYIQIPNAVLVFTLVKQKCFCVEADLVHGICNNSPSPTSSPTDNNEKFNIKQSTLIVQSVYSIEQKVGDKCLLVCVERWEDEGDGSIHSI